MTSMTVPSPLAVLRNRESRLTAEQIEAAIPYRLAYSTKTGDPVRKPEPEVHQFTPPGSRKTYTVPVAMTAVPNASA